MHGMHAAASRVVQASSFQLFLPMKCLIFMNNLLKQYEIK